MSYLNSETRIESRVLTQTSRGYFVVEYDYCSRRVLEGEKTSICLERAALKADVSASHPLESGLRMSWPSSAGGESRC